MADVLSFDELLDLAKPKPPIELEVKAWGGRKVFLRDPTSADVDEWRMYCSRNREANVPFAAKLCQILLCNKDGERIVPQNDQALAALADSDAEAINEISNFAIKLVDEPGDSEMEAVEKN